MPDCSRAARPQHISLRTKLLWLIKYVTIFPSITTHTRKQRSEICDSAPDCFVGRSEPAHCQTLLHVTRLKLKGRKSRIAHRVMSSDNWWRANDIEVMARRIADQNTMLTVRVTFSSILNPLPFSKDVEVVESAIDGDLLTLELLADPR